MLPLRARVDLGAIASPKAMHYGNLTIRLFSVISGHSLGGGYPSAKKLSMYSTAPANWGNQGEISVRRIH